MKIPLIAIPIIKNGVQYVEIWQNSQQKLVLSPFQPYFYSTYKMQIPYKKEETVTKKLFSTFKDTTLYKYSFPNTRYVSQYREDDSIEADIVFSDRILIDQPDFFTEFPNTDPLKILHFDIEVDTSSSFPKPEENAIIAIGCQIGDKKKLFVSKTYDDDEKIIRDFFRFLQKTDPDILSHYNGNKFDIPYLIKRMEINHIPTDLFSRKGKISTYRGAINIPGRISFDIYNEVTRDQTLYGIKNFQMKTVAEWLGFPVMHINTTNMRELVDTQELREYLKSDIYITKFLFDTYFKNVLMLAEMYHIPLNLMVNASPSFLPRIIHGRAFQKLNMVADKTNAERHKKYIKKKQGALVDTFKPGLYNHPIYKVDYKSEYPNIVRTFNLSPETTRIIRYDTLTKNFTFDSSNNKLILSIPDEVINKNIVIEIDMTKRGFLAEFIDNVLTERFQLKQQMKQTKDDTLRNVLHVRQNALKVSANIQTGYEGQTHARFGSLDVYCAITGMGRYFMKLALNYFGKKVISIDTDGIYLDSVTDVTVFNNYIRRHVRETFGLECYLEAELEKFDAAYFRNTKGKHYILKDEDKLKFHGQSFKGSHQPKFFDDVLERLARAMFNGENTRDIINIKDYPIEDLVQRITVQAKGLYKSENALAMQLIRQAESLGMNVTEGDQLAYVKTTSGYELYIPGQKYNIDWKYYQDIVEKIYERLDLQDVKQWSLERWI